MTSNRRCYRKLETALPSPEKLKGKNHEENHIHGPRGSVSVVFAPEGTKLCAGRSQGRPGITEVAALERRGGEDRHGGRPARSRHPVVSNDQFKKIRASKKAAKEYLDSQHIFKRKLIKVVFCDVTPSDDGDGWILLLPHTPHSTASISAWQIPKEMKDK